MVSVSNSADFSATSTDTTRSPITKKSSGGSDNAPTDVVVAADRYRFMMMKCYIGTRDDAPVLQVGSCVASTGKTDLNDCGASDMLLSLSALVWIKSPLWILLAV